MSGEPGIRTAIPKRRYQVGEFGVSLLGEIDSGDGLSYRYIMAFVQEGQAKPELYLCAIENPPGEREHGRYRLRVVTGAIDDVIASGDEWGELEYFAEQALSLGMQTLNLADEQAARLM